MVNAFALVTDNPEVFVTDTSNASKPPLNIADVISKVTSELEFRVTESGVYVVPSEPVTVTLTPVWKFVPVTVIVSPAEVNVDGDIELIVGGESIAFQR